MAALNVIARPRSSRPGAEIDATRITPALLRDTLHDAGWIEANVATGHHAIEFLLIGQNLNGHADGAGNRPCTDYAQGDACTDGNCDRRSDYLSAATELMVSDPDWMAAQWAEGADARTALMADARGGLSAILTGMGALSYGKQAGKRMRLGLMLNDPDEEHDCFSENTHNSHFYDSLGAMNVYLGTYLRIEGRLVSGPALSDLVAVEDPSLDVEMRSRLAETIMVLGRINTAAETGFAYDEMLKRGNRLGEALISAASTR